MKKSHCQALEKIKGTSQQIIRIKAQIQKIAAHARLPVLITGETGTGKELVANALHACSDRHANPLVKINCSAIPENLFESYFFGHKKGAFTGATEDQDGVVKAADQGMLFLDEVSEMPINQQAKLLRFLENQIYSRVGEQTQHQTDIWIVAASNRQSKELRFGKNFRSDLYYRLCGATITLPSLCNRKQDIKTLAYEFAQQACGHSHIKISPKVIDIFYHYSWPGNIRELKHIVEHSCLFIENGIILPKHIAGLEINLEQPLNSDENENKELSKLESNERETISQILIRTGNNKKQSARLLGISLNTLKKKLIKYQLPDYILENE